MAAPTGHHPPKSKNETLEAAYALPRWREGKKRGRWRKKKRQKMIPVPDALRRA